MMNFALRISMRCIIETLKSFYRLRSKYEQRKYKQKDKTQSQRHNITEEEALRNARELIEEEELEKKREEKKKAKRKVIYLVKLNMNLKFRYSGVLLVIKCKLFLFFFFVF